MWLRTRCELSFNIDRPTPFILMLRPRSGAHQWIAREEYGLKPSVPVYEFTDYFGNLCQRLVAPVGSFSICTSADVRVADHIDKGLGAPFTEIQKLPNWVLNYLLPSRYCESDRLNAFAMGITRGLRPGYDQVSRIEQWLRDNIRYAPGSGEVPVSALEVQKNQYGVCRDLAHLGIALCRSISIPARMVVGYLWQLEPMDLHAWFEAYVGGRWYTFDAVGKGSGGYVAVGFGRDAADVAVYNQFGPVAFLIKKVVKVERVEETAISV